MRVLEIITGLPKAAGTSVFVGELANALVARGEEVTVVDGYPEATDGYPLDPRVRHLALEAFVAAPEGTGDVAHVHGLWTPVLHRASVAARRAGIPVVWSTHGMTAPWSLRHKWWKKAVPWFLYQKRDLRRAALVHATVEKEAGWNRALGFERSVVIPLGTRLPSAGALGARVSRTLLYVGRIYPVKALDNLIRAFARVPVPDRRGWRLRLVGPDQAGHRAELEALVASLGPDVADAVVFAGPKFGADLAAEYASSGALALVSHTENFGASVVDALAWARPVVASRQTPWSELPARGCGWWVDNDPETLAGALAELFAASDDRRREMGDRGRALVEEKYTWAAVARDMACAYAALAKGRPETGLQAKGV